MDTTVGHSSSMASATRTTRACDGCRFRKVKCNGASPCSQCAHLNLKCTTSSVPRKRTVGARGRLVEQLRQGGPTAPPPLPPPPAATPSPTVHSSQYGDAMVDDPSPNGTSVLSDSVTSPKTPVPGKSPFSAEFFTSLLPDFDEIVYPVNPVITHEELRAAIANMHNSFEDAALVYAFGAVTINLAQTSNEVHKTLPDLMDMSLKAHDRASMGSLRGGGIFGELPVSPKRVVTCIYLEICMMAYKLYDRSFALLREGIAMVQVMQARNKSASFFSPDARENARRTRMYWELFIHERFLAIAAGYPTVLPALPEGPPTGDDSIPIHVEVGFNRIISMFCILDDRFLDLWSSQTASLPLVAPVTSEWIESKQSELDRDERDTAAAQSKMAMGGHEPLNELQLADLFVTRLWMRTLVWQIALSCGYLRSDPTQTSHEGLSLHFPADRLSSELRSLVGRLESVASVGTHGSGILEKLFEITSTIADVLALPMAQSKTHHENRARMDDFEFLVQFLLGFERVNGQQKVYIQDKLSALQQQYNHSSFGS